MSVSSGLSDAALGRLHRYCKQSAIAPPEHDENSVRHVSEGVLRVVRGDREVHAALVAAAADRDARSVLVDAVDPGQRFNLLDIMTDA